jgi:hypothetical protein
MAVSNLVTTGGLSASDLITEPTWTLIGSYTSTVGVTTTTIGSGGTIPQTYRKLRLYINDLYFATNDSICIRPNNSSTSEYVQFAKYEQNGIINRLVDSNVGYWRVYQVGNASKINCVMEIDNYSSTTDHKFMNYRAPGFVGSTHMHESGDGYWRNASAITSLTIFSLNGYSFSNTSNIAGVGIYLYGAK